MNMTHVSSVMPVEANMYSVWVEVCSKCDDVARVPVPFKMWARIKGKVSEMWSRTAG